MEETIEKKHLYMFIGVIHPERALIQDKALNIKFGILNHPGKWECKARVLCNQLIAHVTTDIEVDEFFLRNKVQELINDELARLAFILGYDFKLSIDRVISQTNGLDRVFGIDNPYISEFMVGKDFDKLNQKLRSLTIGNSGIYMSRAMNDLKSTLSYRDDAAFYCYRALESLKNHYNFINDLQPSKQSEWNAFRKFLNVSKEEIINDIKVYSDASRHGHPVYLGEEDYKNVIVKTWGLVLRYIMNNVPN